MMRLTPPALRGGAVFLAVCLNTLVWCIALLPFAVLKLVLPLAAARRRLDHVLNAIGTGWIRGNSALMRASQDTRWEVSGTQALDLRGWYLVQCNHQTWVDIFVLQHVLNGRIPLLKFFLKRNLIFIPVIGLAWWALGFPFMRRHSTAYLLRHPEKRGEDLVATRQACERFSLVPTSVMTFVEGTRFSAAKHARQRSPYRHLLVPKAGALAFTLSAMGSRFDSLLDVTIAYPQGVPTFWAFLCGRVRRVIVTIERRAVPADLCHGDYAGDAAFRRRVRVWLDEAWLAKDRHLDALLGAAPARDGATRARS